MGGRVRLVEQCDGAPEAIRAHVLVVDDEPLIGSSVRRTLARHRVETVTSAREALDRLLGPDRFDVVLCDVMMPGMSGPDLVEELVRRESYAARRVLFLTGGHLSDAERDLVRSLDVTTLEKPFEPATLRAEVDHILRLRGRAAEEPGGSAPGSGGAPGAQPAGGSSA